MHENAVYPIFLHRMSGVRVVVVGGGVVGERKIGGLLAVEAAVCLISPQATAQLQAWRDAGEIEWHRRTYQPGDLTGAYLAFAATNQREINRQIAKDAADLHVLCNVADAPEEGDFHLPALHREGALTVAVGSRGSNIHAAKQIRDQIVALVLKGK